MIDIRFVPEKVKTEPAHYEILLTLTKEEYEQVERNADWNGMFTSKFIKQAVLKYRAYGC